MRNKSTKQQQQRKKKSSSSNESAPPTKKQKTSASTSSSASEKSGTVELIYFDHKVMEEDEETPVSILQKPFQHNDVKGVMEILEKEHQNSEKKAQSFMEWLLFPAVSVEEFETDYFEKRVMCIRRGKDLSHYYDGIFSSQVHIPALLQSGKLEYTYDLDVTLYKNGHRYTLNPSFPKVADEDMVMDFFKNQKCSIRFLRPHQYVDPLCSMLSQIEEFFQMGSGCNAYWTPAQSQGFAPHYDDVDVFILQVEGTKAWSLYQARDFTEIRPTTSSPNFTQEEVEDYLVTKIVLEPGDLLYCPRGTIHQACTESQNPQDSLHLTLSTSQNMSWRQYLELAIPRAIQNAATSSNEAAFDFNRVLPRNYGSKLGLIHEDDERAAEDPIRQQFEEHLHKLLSYLPQFIPIDDAADEMFVKFLHDRLPPMMALTSKERQKNKLEPEEESDDEDEEKESEEKSVLLTSRIRFITSNVARLVVDSEDKCSLIHATRNTRIYHELEQPEKLEFEIEYAPALDHLLKMYPKFETVSNLPELEDEEKIVLAEALRSEKLIFCVDN